MLAFCLVEKKVSNHLDLGYSRNLDKKNITHMIWFHFWMMCYLLQDDSKTHHNAVYIHMASMKTIKGLFDEGKYAQRNI